MMHEKSDPRLSSLHSAVLATMPARSRTCLQDVERVTEALWVAFDREPTDPEVASALGISIDEYHEDQYWPTDDEYDAFSTDRETGSENGGESASSASHTESASSAEADPCDNPWRCREIQKLPTQLRVLRSSPYGFTWSVYAPEIERAMIKLFTLKGRAPEDTEIAEELHISLAGYHEMLKYLADFDGGTLFNERKPDEANQAVVVRSREAADALFCCMRRELQRLLSDAIRCLPTKERLFITLRYSEFMSDKDIEFILDLDESSSSRIGVSAHLHVSASLAYKVGIGLDGTRRRQSESSNAPQNGSCANEKSNRDDELPYVHVSGTQSGVLHRALAEKYPAGQALWDRHVRTWFSLNQEGELVQMRHKDDYTLRLDV